VLFFFLFFSTTWPICESGPCRRILALLGGTPNDQEAWKQVQAGATVAVERLSKRLRATKTPKGEPCRHGAFHAIAFGIAYGDGLKVPLQSIWTQFVLPIDGHRSGTSKP